ncbi:uncharacterized protein Z520_01568 [Fonsecaea multimorphosa CBS 102226]|uniref:Uncharacterized protein n=1 Tax=Fonsecaea multimorphosa CBS 102226 TaxID=1442371 RepID=A0A0D2HMJ3_9EURO|nr:uncharacterized protein Z520_01568 [Fonsecaea multimorphosa CBS 102226]KIY03101.1 hypothetical protein Z520_01568 [Fonsecaea multimorphosa CBS 102226]
MFRGHAKQPPKKAGRRKKETVPEIEDPELNIFLQLENTARTVGVELDPCLRPSAASSLGNRKPEMKPIDESSDADFNILQSQDAEAHKKRKTKALAFATAQDGEDGDGGDVAVNGQSDPSKLQADFRNKKHSLT